MRDYTTKHHSGFIIAAGFVTDFAAEATVKVCGFTDKDGFEVCETEGNYGYPMVICSGECDRAERPLACRIFPLFPLVTEEDGKINIKVIRDPRATMCPIVRSSKKVDPKFVRQVRMAARYLVRDEKILDSMKNVSLELIEIIELQAMLESGED